MRQEVFVRMAATGKALRPHEEQPYLRQTLRSVAARAWDKLYGTPRNALLTSRGRF